ncbi:MAG TPA: amino acid adenylation domain-containing protein [Longimicrobium sp.]|nr:amino acid adenylation domain-containing protein [Longimicrobium sp.]
MDRRNVEDIYPLSPLQQGMLFHVVYSEGAAYQEQFPLLLTGELDADALERAFRGVVARHAALRTGFGWEGVPQPLQFVLRQTEPVFDRVDWSDAGDDWHARFDALMESDRRRGHNLKQPPLVRITLARIDDRRHLMLLSVHHLVIDGWSLPLVVGELDALYRAERAGRPAGLPPAPRYRDYVQWLMGRDAGAAERFWRGTLAGVRRATPLPLDRGTPGGHAQSEGQAHLRLSAEATARLHTAARAYGLTLYTLVQGAWALLLARYAAAGDVVFGTTVSGRPAGLPGVERAVGLFINTLPVHVRVQGAGTAGEWLQGLQRGQAEARQHEHAALSDVQGWTEVPREEPLFESLLVFENYPVGRGDEEVDDGGLRVGVLPAPERSTYALTLTCAPLPEGLELRLSHDTARFTAADAGRIVAGVAAALEALAEGLDEPVDAISVLAPGEAETLRALARGPEVEPRHPTLAAAFLDAAHRHAAATALVWDGGSMSFGELERRSAALAARLAAAGAGPGQVVGICAHWTPELPVAVYAVLRTGAAYLPLDPGLPPARLAHLLADAGACAAAAAGGLRPLLPASIPVVEVDAAGPLAAEGEGWTDPEIHPASAAWIFYTSGSTGTPKGVVVPHADAVAHVAAARELYALTPADRALGFAAISFDPSLEQLLVPLLSGASLALRGPEMPAPAMLAARLRELGVTVANPPTPYLHLLAADPQALAEVRPALRLMITGGAALHPSAVRAWLAAPGSAGLVNVYGPTETVITSTAFTAVDGFVPGARMPIGTPLGGRTAWVLDEGMRPLPPGAAGELYLGGALARGYLNAPALTASRFLPDPFSGVPGARLYRSGDQAWWRDDGTLEYLGRLDLQVKVRGVRVEPGEVEAVLASLPGVREAAVAARGEPGDERLIAWVVAGEDVDDDRLRADLGELLPRMMVPSAFVRMGALPRTAGGKLDRRALEYDGAAAAPAAFEPPRTDTERELAAIWREVLKIERVGAHDSFLSLGGHSLMAMQVLSRIYGQMGVQLPLRVLFEAPRLADMAAKIDQLLEAALAELLAEGEGQIGEVPAQGEGAPAGDIPRADRDRPLPLSFAQERLWFIDQLEPGSAAYNVPLALDLRGPLDSAALRRALGEIVRRHEPLRTVFAVRDDEPVQVIHPFAGFALEVADLTGLSADARRAEAERRIGNEARRPFDLVTGPMLRATLLKMGEDDHTLVLVFHHIVTDAWSGGIFFRELTTLYQAFAQGGDSPLPDLAIQYADFAAWQRGWLQGEALERQADFWRRRLAGAPAVLPLPADRPRPAVQDVSGALLPFHLTPATAAAAHALARREGATLFMVLLAAFQAVLHRWSGEEDVVVGTPIANRTRPELEGLIGFFDNTLALRTDLSGDPSFAALLGRVREGTLEAYAHQDIPFEKLVDELKVERSLSHTPLFQVMLSLQNTPSGGGVELGGVTIQNHGAGTGTSRFDLTLILQETGDGALSGEAEYATALFDAATIQRLTAHLDALLREAAANPDAPLSTLSLLSADEEAQVLRAFNTTDRPAADAAVHGIVRAAAARTPDAVAVESRGERVTYAELETRANRLAHRLVRLGVRPDARVAVSMERSIDMVISVLAVLKAGGCYVAVDPNYPADRVAYMLEDSRAAVILTTSDVAPTLPDTDAAVVRVDAERAEIGAESADDPGVAVGPENLLYTLYTSGSTGKPKGAALPHRALANLLAWQVERWGDDAAARTLQFASLSFDVSFQEIFGTWAAGGTLVLVDDDTRRDGEALLAYLRDERIERLFLPFAALQNLAETAQEVDASLPALREVITAGEALRSTPQLRAFFRANPAAALENQYGPSETHVLSAHLVGGDPERWPALPPIGAPIGNTQLYVLDGRMRPAPVGVPGELYAGGAPLARGYLGRPALTAEKFVPDPFGPAGSRLYRTGDRVRWTEVRECVSAEVRESSGDEPSRATTHALTHSRTHALEYLGRTDFQVKIRGFRVEPGEIEAALAEHPSVAQAAVVVRGEGAAGRLAAYVVPAAGAQPEPAELRTYLAGRLPEYMVPAAWTVMQALPLTPSGKVDRRSLPEPAGLAAAAGHVPPRTPAELKVADAWEAVLGVRPGAHDNFFDLGGHSLRATQVIARIRRAFGIELPLRALFEAPTVAGLAARAEAEEGADPARVAPLVPVPRGRTTPLSFAQQRFWFVDRMGAAGAAYHMPMSMRLHGELDVAALDAAANGLIERHESLRTVFRLENGEPVQEVLPHEHRPIPVHDLSALAEEEREAEARRIADEDARAPFDLAHGPPIRFALVRLGAGEHQFLVNLHHIVSDWWSLGIVFRELGTLYRAAREGLPDPLPPLPVQYPDFAVWQRRRLAGNAMEQELEWWRRRLHGAPTLALPTDRPHPPVQSFRGGRMEFFLPAQVRERVDRLAREEDATPFMVLLAAFSVLLARWSGADDVTIGSPVAGRSPEETEALVGVFVNTLALRTDLSGTPSFRQALRRVRDATVDAYAHQEVPFERLVEALKVERNLSAHPVFQVMFSMQPAGIDAPVLDGLQMAASDLDTGTTKVDLMLSITPSTDGLYAAWQYATDLWEHDTIQRLSRHLGELLSGAVTRPDTSIWALPVMDAAEEAYVLRELNHTSVDYPRGLAVHQLFEAQVDRTPQSTAIVHVGTRWSYAEVESRANRLSRWLRAHGVGPEVKVAVCMERTPELVVALLGVMKAGGAYVPVDPAYPADRIGFMVDESGAPVVLTHASLADGLPPTAARVLPVDAGWVEVEAESDARLRLPVDERNLAYVIYTSGSTGRPKGVQIEHRSTVALLHWLREHVTDQERQSVLASTSVSFDVSVAEIFGTLSWGGTLVLVRNALSLKEIGEPVVLASMAPSAAAELLRTDGIPPTLKRLNLGGEALPPALAQGLHALGTLETVGNYYGPTEDTTYSTWSFVPEGAERVMVGRPVANTRAYVLDDHLRPVPFGVAGELWLAGHGLSRGYHRRPGLTAGRFLPDPFSDTPGARMYRVGDRVRYRPGGELEYLGRLDFQVKIRGHRIEPGEVEAELAANPHVRQAVVAARGEGAAARLVAWVVPADGASPSAAELRDWLRARVPDYMLPAAFVVVPEFPLSPNGKIDRERLPDPARERPTVSAPRSAMERTVAKVWEEVLGITGVGLDDNFFESGGHSLLLARMQERLEEAAGRPVTVVDLFQFSTVRALAAHLDSAPDAGVTARPDTAAEEPEQDRGAMRRAMMRRGRR